MTNQKVLIISGPTACGKTSTSIKIAKLLEESGKKTIILNFDSLLFYKEISIGTAKPTTLEKQGITHELIDIASIKAPINAADFIKIAKEKINESLDQGLIPIIVGGSAFYLRALIKGMYEGPSISKATTEHIEKIINNEGNISLVDYLKKHDPESLEKIHINDQYRLARACEFHYESGQKISEQRKLLEENNPYDFSIKKSVTWDFLHIYLDIPKEEHIGHILSRADHMLKSGLIDEVKDLLKTGLDPKLKPLQSIGYKETIQFIKGEISSIEELKERIHISTRQLAKSQRTFFKKITPKESFHPINDIDKITQLILQLI